MLIIVILLTANLQPRFSSSAVPARGRPKKMVIEDEEEEGNSKGKADNGSDDDAFDTKPGKQLLQ
jgi:hypothetical protein